MLLVLILGGGLKPFISPTCASERGGEPQAGLLLLANGQVLSGQIASTGDGYLVTLDTGELRVKKSEVEMFCRSLEEGYQRKRAALVGGQINEHLALADWCINQQLYGLAAQELTEAMRLDPRHPKIALMERRLELEQHRATKPRERTSTLRGPSNDDLERLARTLPEGAVDAFTHTIQPLLLNSCTKSGCHSHTAGGQFALLRIPVGRPSSRSQTLRNLHAVVAQINSADPAQSPLLTVPVKEHGTARGPIFSNHEMLQYRQLMVWTYRVSQQAPPYEASVAPATPATTAPAPTVAPASANLPTAAPPATTIEFRSAEPTGVMPATSTSPTPADLRAKPIPGDYVPVDPFDPEAFHRAPAASPGGK